MHLKLKITDAFPSRLDLLYAMGPEFSVCEFNERQLCVFTSTTTKKAPANASRIVTNAGKCNTWPKVTLYHCERTLSVVCCNGSTILGINYFDFSHLKAVKFKQERWSHRIYERYIFLRAYKHVSKWKRMESRPNGWQWQLPNWNRIWNQPNGKEREWQTIELCGFYTSHSVFVYFSPLVVANKQMRPNFPCSRNFFVRLLYLSVPEWDLFKRWASTKKIIETLREKKMCEKKNWTCEIIVHWWILIQASKPLNRWLYETIVN